MTTILLADPDPALLRGLGDTLRREGYAVRTAADGAEALAVAQQTHPDLLLLAVLLPRVDGLEVCRRLRAPDDCVVRPHLQPHHPVDLLPARRADEDGDGAQPCVVKPFSVRELLARVKALLGRARRAAEVAGGRDEAVLTVGDLALDPAAGTVRRRGKEVALKPREFALLAFLLRHPGRVFTRAQLLAQVWPAGGGGAYAGDIWTVDVHVRWLREKLERDPRRPKLLETVRGVGYRLRAPAGAGPRPVTGGAPPPVTAPRLPAA